ncbi:MAG: HAD family phosphatase [Bacteroidia bacterium]|nr:HAD family phosphatase [Bacteroidia bacterium]
MMNKASIRHLLLDLGGVLYEIDIAKTVQTYNGLRHPGAPEIDYSKASQHAFFDQLDQGKIEIDDFAKGLRDAYQLDAELDLVKQIWMDLLIGVLPGRADDMEQLAQYYNIALLSNTSRFHHDFYREACDPMFRHMDHLFFSFDMGLRKPDAEIYLAALTQMGWKAEETLFVDDSWTNIEAAQQLGIQTYWMETHDHWQGLMTALV